MDKDKRKELKMQYKLTKPEAGVYMIKNVKNGRMLIDTLNDLKTLNGKKHQLEMDIHMNTQLQAEWECFGEKAFTFEVLEVLKEKEEPGFDKEKELEKLKKKWLEILRPFGKDGYS